jgi:hypothetical protein
MKALGLENLKGLFGADSIIFHISTQAAYRMFGCLDAYCERVMCELSAIDLCFCRQKEIDVEKFFGISKNATSSSSIYATILLRLINYLRFRCSLLLS